MFSPVLLEVPGQMTRCPCGFGAYSYTDCVTCVTVSRRSCMAYVTWASCRRLNHAPVHRHAYSTLQQWRAAIARHEDDGNISLLWYLL